ncbi:MAG: hypothetical protein LUO79_00890 [Methanomassiliicoccales archaeon]|nr:hypothetical protein [Methanomassiliicoccales archaeon]
MNPDGIVSVFVEQVSRKEMAPGLVILLLFPMFGLIPYALSGNPFGFVFMLVTGIIVSTGMIKIQYLEKPIQIDVDHDGVTLRYRLLKTRKYGYGEIVWMDVVPGGRGKPSFSRFKIKMVRPVYISYEAGKAIRHSCVVHLGARPPIYEEWLKAYGGNRDYTRVNSE